MKRFIAVFMALMLVTIPALAESVRVFVADTDSGAVLIDENGNLVTGLGDYDVIDLISYDECPPERELFMVSQLDISDGFFLEDEYGDVTGWEDAEWDEELDAVEDWPDTEGLDEGYDMEIVDDQPIDDELGDLEEFGEFADELGDDEFGMELYEDDLNELEGYMDYGVALMNVRGELLTDFEYVGFQHDVENAVVAAYNFEGFVTMLDEQGNVLLSGEYTSAVSDGQGGFIAVKPEIDPETGDFSETAPVLRISADGSATETGLYTFSYETLPGYSEGLMCVPACDPDSGMDSVYEYVYVDQNGAEVFGAAYEYAMNFVDGYAEVTDADYVAHLIDRTGAYVTDGEYSYFELGSAGDNMPIVANLIDGGFDLISKTDLSVIASFRPEEGSYTLYAYQSGDGLIMAYSETENMIIDAAGNVLYRGSDDLYAQTWYEYADSQPERLLLSRLDDSGVTMCVAGFDGTPVSDWYGDVLALSWMNGQGRYQVLNYELIEVEYDDTVGYEPDIETFAYGVIDQDGNVIVDMKYDYFAQLAHDRYWAAQGTSYSLMDSDGNVIASFEGE